MSVCIVTNNRVNLLRRCIDSVMMQSYKNVEFFIFDNCTTDGTSDYLWSLADDEVDIRWIVPYKPMEAIASINCLFKRVNSPYILILDDDAELIEPDTIERMIDIMNNDSSIAILGTRVIGPNNEEQFVVKDYNGMPYERKGLYHYHDFKGACAMFRTSQVAPLGYYDSDFKLYMNELDLSLKCLNAQYIIAVDTSITIRHHGNIRIGNANQYLSNYDEVLFRYFDKVNAIKMFGLNYFIVGYYGGKWVSNLYITMKYVCKVIVRTRYDRVLPMIQDSLVNGTIRSIKDAL